MHRWSALVPELTATASEAPRYRAINRSNSSSFGPKLSCGVRSTAVTASMSCSLMSGADRGIRMVSERGMPWWQRCPGERAASSVTVPDQEDWKEHEQWFRPRIRRRKDSSNQLVILENPASLPCEFLPESPP